MASSFGLSFFPRSVPFSESVRVSSLSVLHYLFLSLALFSFYFSLSLSLGLGQSADHSNAPYRNYDYRHYHVTARTVRSRINETARESPRTTIYPPTLPLHLSRCPHAASNASHHSCVPPLPVTFASPSSLDSRDLALVPVTLYLLALSLSLLLALFLCDSPPHDQPPRFSPPFPYLMAFPSRFSSSVPGTALEMHDGSTWFCRRSFSGLQRDGSNVDRNTF